MISLTADDKRYEMSLTELGVEFLELLQLHYFVKVARAGSITRAAREMYISQPALSTTIARLESDLGVQLFKRTANRITLTEAGEIYLRYVEQALGSLEEGRAMARRFADGTRRSVHVATAFGVTRHIRNIFNQEYSDIEVTLAMCEKQEEILKLLLSGEADFGISLKKIKDSRVTNQVIMSGRWFVAVKAGESAGRTVTLEQLSGERLFCSRLGETERLVRKLFDESGLACNVIALDEKDVLFEAVEKGLGHVICIPMLYDQYLKLDQNTGGLQFVMIEDAHAVCSVSLVQPAGKLLSPGGERMREAVERHFGENDRRLRELVAEIEAEYR